MPSEPRERWTSDPNRAEVRDGNLYGRGACDMKGGVAAMVFAAEVLARLGVRLHGDLIVNTVTDEESSGAGGLAAVRHGVRADAGIVTEPTAFEVWVALPRLALARRSPSTGRPGHAEMAQPHWRDGGAVNAIEKLAVVLDAVAAAARGVARRRRKQHPHLSARRHRPRHDRRAASGSVTYPASCTPDLRADVPARPNADADGWGTLTSRPRSRSGSRAPRAADPWLREHPPPSRWGLDIPPYEVDPAHPIVATMLRRAPRPASRRGWAGSTRGSTPPVHPLRRHAVASATARAASPGRTPIDEYVPVDDLVRCAQALALAHRRRSYCGVAE